MKVRMMFLLLALGLLLCAGCGRTADAPVSTEQQLPPTAGEDEAAPRADFGPEQMTLADVRALSLLGDSLRWDDLAPYAGDETGSGIYIRVFPVDENFSLVVGSGSFPDPLTEIWYARLVCEADLDCYVDIREGDVESFLQNDAVLQTAPALTVCCGDSATVALPGTRSWHYTDGDGMTTAVEADSMHPLQAQSDMNALLLEPSPYSHVDPLQAWLQFDVAPDTVSVRCWNSVHWDDPTAQAEEIPVAILCMDSDGIPCAPVLSMQLKDGSYVYEVTAEWNRAEHYGGRVHYSFYAEWHFLERYCADPGNSGIERLEEAHRR